MHLIGILFGLVLLALIAKALLDTLYGLVLILAGLVLGAIGMILSSVIRLGGGFADLWRTAFD